MNTAPPFLSANFKRLYCDASALASFSTTHPISFSRVLPFQSQDQLVDDVRLIGAELAHLGNQNDLTRREVIEAYARCGLLGAADAENVKAAIDCFGGDFFELMGQVYADAGMFICALRWYREFIRELESQAPNSGSPLDSDGVHPSIGYCLYSLGLFEEAISWTKSCVGPELLEDAVCRSLIEYEAQRLGGSILAVERSGHRRRYTLSASVGAEQANENASQLKRVLKDLVPSVDIYLSWLNPDAPEPEFPPDGYPFRIELDGGDLPRHKMNLIFALCGQADALAKRGDVNGAKQLLAEVTMIEPEAIFQMK